MFLLITAVIFYVFLGNIRIGPLYFLVAFPGVFLHELAHLLVAVIMNGKPESMTLIPKKESDGTWTLGTVSFYPSWWNGGFVALAPLYMLPLIGVALVYALEGSSVLHTLIGGYILACIGKGFWPSTTDWVIALKYPAGTLVVLAVVGKGLAVLAQTYLGWQL